MLPAEKIIMEHYRLGSTRAILSRSFCNTEENEDIQSIEEIFDTNMIALREYEKTLPYKTEYDFIENKKNVEHCVKGIVSKIKGRY